MSIPSHKLLRTVPDTDAETIPENDEPADSSQRESSGAQATAVDAPRAGAA